MTALPVILRASREGDHALIMQTWYRLLRQQGPRWLCSRPSGKHERPEEKYPGETLGHSASYMPNRFFDAIVAPRLRVILAKLGAVIACGADDDDLIYGFRVGDQATTHVAFVKSHYRRMGIGEMLFSGASPEHVYTLSTPTARRIMARGKVPVGWLYDVEGMWRYAQED